MGTKGIVAVLALAGLLAGCEEPSPFDVGQTFTYNANQWTVSDRPDLNELQIVAQTTYSSSLGTTGAYRYQVDDLPQPVFEAAVQGWFLVHGRHCTASGGTMVAPKTWVFQYSCWIPTYSPG
jgi:hypothetical protein